MLRAREAIMISFRPILAKHGFTEQQWRVLRVLGEKGPSDAGQVAFDACILAPSLSRIIGKLEKEKFISRCVDQKDARRVNLVITPLGEETLKKIVLPLSPDYTGYGGVSLVPEAVVAYKPTLEIDTEGHRFKYCPDFSQLVIDENTGCVI